MANKRVNGVSRNSKTSEDRKIVKEKKVDTSELKLVCPYCLSEFSADMYVDLETSTGCDTCGYGSGAYGELRIFCKECEKLVYRKSISSDY